MNAPAFPNTIRRLTQDHIDMRMALSTLEREVDSIAQYHEPDAVLLGGAMQYFANFPARCHHPVEEMIYAALKARSPLAAVRAGCVEQHARIVEYIGELSMTTRNLFLETPKWRVPFCGTARNFITLKRDHIRDEERNLFRLSVEHLSAEEWQEIDRAARDADARWSTEEMSYDVLGLRIDRGARATGSARRR
jgi:hemerythrin-like domain-containing protein